VRYTSDLTDAEWQHLDDCFPKPSKKGRRRKHPFRELLNAIFSQVRTGCQWRNLPKDFAPWCTVYHYFRCWKRKGLWNPMHPHLREHLRWVEGRKPQPRAAIIDRQSVTSSETSAERGYDAGKKINGRKRHLLVDTLGLVLRGMVLPANIQDRDEAKRLRADFFSQRTRRRVQHIWADGGDPGTLLTSARQLWRGTVEIVKRSELHPFKGLPRRWVVERTFGWLGRDRRLSRDYERQATTGETMVYLAMIRLMLARLGKA